MRSSTNCSSISKAQGIPHATAPANDLAATPLGNTASLSHKHGHVPLAAPLGSTSALSFDTEESHKISAALHATKGEGVSCGSGPADCDNMVHQRLEQQPLKQLRLQQQQQQQQQQQLKQKADASSDPAAAAAVAVVAPWNGEEWDGEPSHAVAVALQQFHERGVLHRVTRAWGQKTLAARVRARLAVHRYVAVYGCKKDF